MNSRSRFVVFILPLLALPLLALRAHASPARELEQLRFAALWPDFGGRQTPHPAVVRVIAKDRDGLSLGSGTLVDANDEYGLVVTNWHVVRDAVGPIEVVFPGGFRSPARVVRTDRQWDLASLLIQKPPVLPVTIATATPQRGEPLTIAGYGGEGKYKAQTGRCTQYLAPGMNKPFEIVEVSAAARQGDSGGPIFNSRGELAGVLFGEGGGRTSGSYAGRVDKFLQLTAADLRGPSAANIAQSVAPPPTRVAQRENAEAARADRRPTPTSSAQFAGNIGEAGSDSHGMIAESRWPETSSPRVADKFGGSRQLIQGGERARPLAIGDSPLPTSPSRRPSASIDSSRSAAGMPQAWLDEIKSFLAAIGIAAVALQVLRLARG